MFARRSHVPFFFNDTATTEIYSLSLHDALPISCPFNHCGMRFARALASASIPTDRKSTRLNSSHGYISYAVFCLKKTQGNLNRTTLPTRLHPCQQPPTCISPS